MDVLSIVGARPQFVKAAVVSKQLRAVGCAEQLLHTGQHYDFNMSEVFFRELGLPEPDYSLGIGSGRHGAQTAAMLGAIEDVLLGAKPDVVIIYGDTNTTLAAALAPAKLHIPVAHVEAGLRSYNREMPEELNRVVADHCSSVLFCPTQVAVENLRREGFRSIVDAGKLIAADRTTALDLSAQPLVVNVGDVMLDIARQVKGRLDSEPDRAEEILARHGLRDDEYLLATIHRASNTDDAQNLRGIVEAMRDIADRGLKVFFPVHPRTRKALEGFGLREVLSGSGVVVSDPVSYAEMIALESRARLILTDSGGVQKEAYFFAVPCVVARTETEWTELAEIGWNRIAGAGKDTLVAAVDATLADDFTGKDRVDFYGDGRASARIAAVLEQWP